MKFVDWLLHGEEKEKETEFLPAILEVTETPPSPVGRTVMWTVLILIVVAIAWGFLGHINEVAVANGKVSGHAKTIQVKNKGIVKEIKVIDGQHVNEGDELVILDPTTTTADYDNLKKRAAYYELDIQRLQAELEDREFIPQRTEFLDNDDLVAEKTLYDKRRADYETQISSHRKIIDQRQARLLATQETLKKYEEGLAIAADKESRLEQLSAESAISEFQLLEQKRETIEYRQNAQSTKEELASIEAEIAEAEQNLVNITATYHKEIMTALVESKKELYSIEESIKKAEEDSRMSTILSPVSGRVFELDIHTIGGIVTDAQKLMQIIPDGTDMTFEVYADNKDIGFIKLGQTAEVKITTFNFQKFGMIDAVVEEISANAVDEPQDIEKHGKYKLRLKPLQNAVDVEGTMVELAPGMSVSAEIKIKEKRIIDFFLDPFRKYTSEALRER